MVFVNEEDETSQNLYNQMCERPYVTIRLVIKLWWTQTLVLAQAPKFRVQILSPMA